MTEATSAPHPPGWVPADRRFLGLDRTTIRPALIVLALAILMHWVVPAIDAVIPHDDPVVAGDSIGLSRGVEFTPIPGWGIEDGLRVGHPDGAGAYPHTARVVSGDTSFTVETAKWSGSTNALLTQLRHNETVLHGSAGPLIATETTPIQTASGQQGLLSRYQGGSSDGLVAAFVIDGTGVKVVVTTSTDPDANSATDVGHMLSSIRPLSGATK